MLRFMPLWLALGACGGKHHGFTSAPVRPDPHDPSAQRWSAEAGVPGESVRLLLVGDAGHHRPAETVQRLLRQACERQGGCDAVVVLGNNIGRGPWNAQARTALEQWTGRWQAPTYFATGRREWGMVEGWRRADKELEHIAFLPRMGVAARGSGHFYGFAVGPVRVDVLDGTDLRRECGRQGTQLRGACAKSEWKTDLVAGGDEPWRLIAVHEALETVRGREASEGSVLGALVEQVGCDLVASGQGHHLEYRAHADRALVQSGSAARREKLPANAQGEATWAGTVDTPPRRPSMKRMDKRRTVSRTAHGGVMIEATTDRICVEPVPVARVARNTWALSGVEPERLCKEPGGSWTSEGGE